MSVEVTAEAAAQRKTTNNLPAAARYVLQRWAAETVKVIKEGLAGRYLNRGTGQLARSVDKVIRRSGEVSEATIGTNVRGKTNDVPYARIQDEGGWIVPRRARALTIPIGGEKGRARDYANLQVIKTASGKVLLVEKVGRSWKVRFLLVRSVKLPATNWFSYPWAEQLGELRYATSAESLWATAAEMAYKSSAPAAAGGE
jgi:hypothetical protein